MNKFYKQAIYLQWLLAILLLIAGFYPALIIIELAARQNIYAVLFIFYVPIGQFSSTPFFKLIGVYRYYSPMLLGYMANNIQIDLHSGGSFDYLFVMGKYRKGIKLRNQLLRFQIEGLLEIVHQIERGQIPSTVNIIGTSYFFNERTIKKMGFETEQPTLFYRLNLFVNFIDLFWMYSLSKGKISIPKVWEAKKLRISGHKLLENKDLLYKLQNKMLDVKLL